MPNHCFPKKLQLLGLASFWTLSIVRYYKGNNVSKINSVYILRRGSPALLGHTELTSINVTAEQLSLVISNGSDRACISPPFHVRTETVPVSKALEKMQEISNLVCSTAASESFRLKLQLLKNLRCLSGVSETVDKIAGYMFS
jgi:hypothetical protein